MQSIIEVKPPDKDSYPALESNQARLKEFEDRYRLIADHASDMIVIIKPESLTFSYVSPSFEKVMGYSAQAILGQKCLHLVVPDDRADALEGIREGIEIGFGMSRFRMIKKDLAELWVEALGKNINTEVKNSEILIVIHDISERKLTEIALRESELRLRTITDNMLDSVCSLSETGVFDYVSPSHQYMMGFEADELMGKHNLHLLHPDDRNRMLQFFASLMNTDSCGTIEYRALHKEGHYIWMESVGRVFVDENNGTKQCVVGTRDITTRKKIEAELRQREEDLRNKVDYLNTLIDNMNELCYTYDRDFRITFVNQKVLDITGYSLKEVVGKSFFNFIPAFDHDKVMQQVINRIKKGNTSTHEHCITCKDGRELLLKVKSSAILDYGEVTGSLVLAEDITQQRKIEKEMARLGQMNTVGEMAASIGHEIRNPMTTVQGFLQMMSQNEKLKEQRPYFDLMLEELSRANSIITEFLSLAKDKLVYLKNYNLNKIVQALSPLLLADAIKEDKYIEFMLGEIPELLLDEKEIRQLILNLVRNGLEAMSPGGTIIIKTLQEEDGIILSVQDEGTGIVPEIREQLGTPFCSSKENGIGLGLAVCYSIVARHNARMDFETGPAGTIFWVKFPIL